MTQALPISFYARPASEVARDLLGLTLVHRTSEGIVSGKIVETEAYLGTKDPASHAFGGRCTERTKILFQGAGRAYVYLIYGMYHCLNLTAGVRAQDAECVLIRALEPLEGKETMSVRRRTDKVFRLASGPGKLCQALGIGRELTGRILEGPDLFVCEGAPQEEIATSPRIGIDYAGEARDWPLRFAIKNSPYLSRR